MKATSLLVLFCVAAALTLPGRALAQDSFTPSGATRIDIKVSGSPGFIFKPTRIAGVSGRPWLWYAPTLLSAHSPERRLPNLSTHWLFTRLLARGIWIAGMDIGESYGAPPGRALYSKFYQTVTSQYHLSKKPCFLAQSRGGLMSFDWAEEHPGDVRCMAGIYPVFNLNSWPPKDSVQFPEAVRVYGYASAAEFRKHLVQLSPLAHARPLAKRQIPILILHGDADRLVPVNENSRPFVTKYRALGGPAELIVVPGRGHEEVDEYFHSSRLLDFLLDQLVKPTGN